MTIHRTIPIDLLNTFLLLLENQNFSKTADVIGRSQSAVSLQMKRLQGIVGSPIFTSSGKSMKLTQQGEILADYASKLVKLNSECIDRLDGNILTGKIKIGLPSDFAAIFLPGILGQFTLEHPKIEIDVKCDLSTELKHKVDDRDYDLVLAFNDGPPSQSLVKLWRDSVCWVGVKNFKLYKKRPLPLVLFTEGCQYRSRMMTALRRENIPAHVVYSSSDIAANYAAMQAGLGITAMAKSAIPPYLREIPKTAYLPTLETIDVGLHWSDRGATVITKKLATYLMNAMDGKMPKVSDSPQH